MKKISFPSVSFCKQSLHTINLKKVFLFFFASVGVFLCVSFLLTVLSFKLWLAHPQKKPASPKEMILMLDFSRPIVDRAPDFSLSLPALLAEKKEIQLLAILSALRMAKDDPRIKGVVAYFNGVEKPSLSQAQEIKEALGSFKESGKLTYSFAPSYGSFSSESSTYYLASQFQEIWLQPIGAVGLTGLGIETPFGKSVLDKIGIQADFMRREEYKSFMQNTERNSFSPPVRANMQSLMDSLYGQLASGIADGLHLKTPEAKNLIAKGPYTSSEALKAKLVTRLGYEDEFADLIKEKMGKDSVTVDPETYLYYKAQEEKGTPKAELALIYAEGMISDGPKQNPYRLARQDVIDTDAVVEAFATASENEDIKGILFRVNSPGGSPVASETIRRAMRKAQKEGKPVFVSMGPVAASGGYWIAMNADRIIADPATLTGSIGVVAGKFVAGALFDKIGLHWDSLTTSDNAQLWSMQRPFGPKEKERMNAMLDETYGAFIKNVSEARKIPMKKMPEVAKGRVFTGEQALKVGLIDELGGMQPALDALKKHLKLEEKDRIALHVYPRRETARSFLFRLLNRLNLGSVLLQTSEGQALLEMVAQTKKLQSFLAPLLNEMEETGAVKAVLPHTFRTLY